MAEKTADLRSQLSSAGSQAYFEPQRRPEGCSDSEMRIARDGTWFYQGTAIVRPAMVRLFASVLRREGDAYFLVTPVEKLAIQVDDAPFVAVAVSAQGKGDKQLVRFTSNVGDVIEVGPAHPLHVAVDARTQEPSPYVHVRANLQALILRSVFYQLVELAQECEIDGLPWLGLWSGGVFFPMAAL
jgi:hypothetical protein